MCDRLRGFLVPGMMVVFFKEAHSKFGWNLELWLVAIWLPGIYRRSDLRCSSCRYLRRGFEIVLSSSGLACHQWMTVLKAVVTL